MIIQNTFDDKKRYVQFTSAGRVYEVDQYPAGPEVMGQYGTPIPSGWFSWGHKRKMIKKQTKEAVLEKSQLTTQEIQWFIGRPAIHQFFGDAKSYSADTALLVNAWRKGHAATVQKYKFPDFDCEDFSFHAMGLWHKETITARMATYIIWVSYSKAGTHYAHALNAFCEHDAFYLVDPQDRSYTPFRLPDHYKIQVLIG